MTGNNTIEVVNAELEKDATQDELQRRAELLLKFASDFTRKGNDYFQVNKSPNAVAFSRNGNVLSTDYDNPEIVNGMFRLMDASGWEDVKVSGSNTFYSEVERLIQLSNERIQAERHENIAEEQNAVEKSVAAETVAPKNDRPRIEPTTEDVQEQHNLLDKELQDRREALAKQVYDQFRVSGSRYYFKDQVGSVNMLAFRESGDKFSTSLNTERVTTAIVTMAESKGWDSITVRGNKEFKRQVWQEATRRGIEVTGYEPDKKDLAALDAKNNTKQSNIVEKATTLDASQAKPGKARDYQGTLVAHGVAPYKNKKDNNVSYFLTLDTEKGRQTVWGKDLERSISVSGVKTGDRVRARNIGSKPVTVDSPIKDARGKVIGSELIETNRNSWSISRTEKRQVIEAVATELIATKVANSKDRQKLQDGITARLNQEDSAEPLPDVRVYDNDARPTPTAQPERSKQHQEELTR